MAKNCEMSKQLENALSLITVLHSQAHSKVEAMSKAIHLLQEMIASERELEVEHWLLPPMDPSAASRRQKSIKVLLTLVNERILKTKTMSSIISEISLEEESKDEVKQQTQLKSQCTLVCSIFGLLTKLQAQDNGGEAHEVVELER